MNAPERIQPSWARRVHNAHGVMDLIRQEIHGHDPKELADEVMVSVSTIYGIRCGRTKWPRPKTFFGLCEALGLRITVSKGAYYTGGV